MINSYYAPLAERVSYLAHHSYIYIATCLKLQAYNNYCKSKIKLKSAFMKRRKE